MEVQRLPQSRDQSCLRAARAEERAAGEAYQTLSTLPPLAWCPCSLVWCCTACSWLQGALPGWSHSWQAVHTAGQGADESNGQACWLWGNTAVVQARLPAEGCCGSPDASERLATGCVVHQCLPQKI